MIKKVLAQIDIKFFAEFKKKYPGWDIYRLEDNSLVFVKPQR
jgi:hypothetical protein